MITQLQAKRRLAASICNERRTYAQHRFTSGPVDAPATCGTARCIAGHIEACWPGTTRRLLRDFPERYVGCTCSECNGQIMHADLARDVWQEVTGKPCRFDFRSRPLPRPPTREDAVAHIYGRHKEWPLRRRGVS